MFREQRRRRTRVAFIALGSFLFAAASGCGGPIGPIPGGALSGEIGPRDPAGWEFARDVENAQLETRSADPHSVNTWFTATGPALYVPTSMILGPTTPTDRSWVGHVAEDARVRIRLGKIVFERLAIRVEDPLEFERARRALEEKYSIDEEDRDPDRTIWIYRLDPRPL